MAASALGRRGGKVGGKAKVPKGFSMMSAEKRRVKQHVIGRCAEMNKATAMAEHQKWVAALLSPETAAVPPAPHTFHEAWEKCAALKEDSGAWGKHDATQAIRNTMDFAEENQWIQSNPTHSKFFRKPNNMTRQVHAIEQRELGDVVIADESDFIFPSESPHGWPENLDNFLRRHLKPFAAGIGMPHLTFRLLRKTAASLFGNDLLSAQAHH